MGQDARIGRRGRGKPRKSQEIIGNMVLAHSPDHAGPVVFSTSDAYAGVIEDVGPAAKLSRISEIVGLRLGNAVAEAISASDSADRLEGSESEVEAVRAAIRPWLDGSCPINAFSVAERAGHENERIMATLTRHLVEHLILGEELRATAVAARRRAVDELYDLPAIMVDFVNRLMASGVVTRDVRNMSRERLASVVAAIRGVDSEATIDAVPEGLPACSWTDTEASSSTVVRGHVGGGVDDLDGPDDGLSDTHGDVADVPMVGAADGSTTGSSTPTPKAMSELVGDDSQGGSAMAGDSRGGSSMLGDSETRDDVADVAGGQLGVLALRFEAGGEPAIRPVVGTGDAAAGEVDDLPASSSADPLFEGGDGPLAEVPGDTPAGPATMVSVGVWTDIDIAPTGYVVEEWTMADDADLSSRDLRLPPSRSMVELSPAGTTERRTAVGATDQVDALLTRRFVMMYSSRMGLALTEEEVRLWVFLFHEARVENPAAFYGRSGWYDGVRLPPQAGSAKARRLVRVDRSEVSGAATPAALARAAI